jgi:hypothetical protein
MDFPSLSLTIDGKMNAATGRSNRIASERTRRRKSLKNPHFGTCQGKAVCYGSPPASVPFSGATRRFCLAAKLVRDPKPAECERDRISFPPSLLQ